MLHLSCYLYFLCRFRDSVPCVPGWNPNDPIQLTQLANLGADLSLIEGAKKMGTLKISKNVSETEEFVLINQSPADLFESEIDLKTILAGEWL